jgi:MFS family permease
MQQVVYRNYLLFILMVVLAFSYVDRMVFGVALEFIKADLHVGDMQLGILSGIGFALFFSVVGFPIARWADRGDRVLIISLTTVTWSVAVCLCGVAGSFLQMFLVRIGVAAGEAGCVPLAGSLIPDYFSRAERPRAVARYFLGTFLGLTVGYFAGGWLIEFYGWRATFLIVGLPGLALAALAAMTLKEPRRVKSADICRPVQSAPSETIRPNLKEATLSLWTNTTFRHLLLFCLVWYFCGWGLQQWLPAFFIRSHQMAAGELGTWLAVVYGTAGILGTWLGGEWGSRRAVHNESLQLIVAAVLFALSALFYASALLVANQYLALGAIALVALVQGMATGPIFATIQTLVPARMRATAQALVVLLPSLIGAGFGPLVVGTLSDAWQPWFGDQSLRYALLTLCPGFCLGAWHLRCASQSVTRDLQDGQAEFDPQAIAPTRLVIEKC